MRKKISICISGLIGIVCIFLCGGVASATWQDVSCNQSCEISRGACLQASSGYTVPYCVQSDCDYASSCMRGLLTNELSKYRRNGDVIEQESDFLKHYCSILLGSGQDKGRIYYSVPMTDKSGNWDWQQTFDSHQSLFVYALCSSFQDKDGNFPFLVGGKDLSSVFQGKKGDIVKILKLQQRSKGKNLCSLIDDKSLQDCDMSIYASEIFSAIMSEAFKIKYAEVFHVNDVENFADKEDRITSFLRGYYNMTDGYKPLQGEIPQTIDVINSNQQYYKRVLDKLRLINNTELSNMAGTSKCPESKIMSGADFIACAMHGSHGTGLALDPAFVTRVYNEILNYSVFVQNHKNRLDALIANLQANAGNEKTIRELQAKSNDLALYAKLQIDTTKNVLQDLEDLDMTYPLHIGMLLYQEKVKRFRDKSLSPVVTLFYSLSEKLQNVQFPD